MSHSRSGILSFSIAAPAAFLAALAFCSCVHTPPGTSVNVALAKKAELLRAPLGLGIASSPAARGPGGVRVPAVEPELPRNDNVERVAEAFSRGNFCMQAGNDREAIAAFEEAVKIDSSFTDAWQNLAVLYEKQGDEKKAIEAFRRAKKIARQ